MASPRMPLPELNAPLVGEFEELLRRAVASHRLAELTERGWKGAWTVAHQRIGETAGAIWQRLSQEGPQTLGVLMHEVNVPESLFFMAVGWLSREGKLEFEPTDGDYTVWLR